MSNIDKRALREEFQYMQERCSGPYGRQRQALYRGAEELLDELEAKDKRIAELQAMLARLYAECDTGERRGNGSQSGVAMPSWVTVEAARLLLGVK